ncbi:hemagglutinin repeat-containing protein [Citrobacter koseri]|uniref:hemagglutinin repeat-containing protein n=1 Tax=Citrobacter koseri TaxID=545 RepID=UPI0040413743
MAGDNIGFSQRLLSGLLSLLIAAQPVLPAVAATITPTGNTQMDKAANGVPVVNIATPNGAGISHNKFQDYNVGKEGLILNNATGQLNHTQLGGILQNNPNLKAGKEASGIINEVTGTNRSLLQGYTEVAGKAANVMVANPYGITCNGCGFINTPNATLTTGKPVLDANGNLQALEVTKGSITIEGQGLDGSQSDAVSVIARATEINAALHAKDLSVIVGANRVGADGKVSARQGEGAAPKVAVDTSALGGMYANRIRLVSGEKGVGVNLGNLNARQGDITLSSAGKLVLKNSLASGNTAVTGTEVVLSGDHQAGGNLTATAQGGLTLDKAQMASGRSLQLTAGGKLTQNGGSLTAATDTRLTAGSLTQSADAQAGADSNLAITVADSAALKGKNVAGQDATVKAKTLTTGTELSAARHLSLNAEQNAALDGVVVAGQQLSVTGGGDLTQRGTLNGTDITLSGRNITQENGAESSAGGNIALTTSEHATLKGKTVAGKSLSVSTGSLDNRGTLAAGNDATLKAGLLTSSGTVQGGSLTVRATDLTSTGDLKSASSLDIGARNVTLAGDTGAKGKTTVAASGRLDNSGTLVSDDALTLSATQVDNRGTLSGAKGLAATAATWTAGDKSVTHSGSALTLDTRDTVLAGETSAGGAVSVKGDTLRTASTSQLQGDSVVVDVRSAQLDGTQAAAGSLRLSARDSLTHGGKSSAGTLDAGTAALTNTGTLTASSLTLNTPALVNSGLIQGQQTLNLTTWLLDNRAVGTLTTGGNLQLDGTDITSAGKIITGGRFDLRNGRLVNRGDVSGADILLSDVSLNNLQDGLIYTDGLLSLTGSTPDNAGEIQAGRLALTADRLSNSGTLRTLSSADIHLSDALVNPGRLLGYGSLDVAAGGLQNNGTVAAENLVLSLSSLENNGLVQGNRSLGLDVPRLVNGRDGQIFSGSDLALSLTGSENHGLLQVSGQLALDGDTFTNAGYLVADGLDLRLTGNLYNRAGGELLAGDTLAIQSAGLDNRGLILGEGSADVHATALDNSGTLAADTLALTADVLGISGLVQGMKALTLAARQMDTGGQARLLSAGDVAIRADGALTSAGAIQGRDVTVSAADWLHNGVLLATGRLSSVVTGLLTQNGEMMSQGDSDIRSRTLTNTGRLLSEGGMRLDGNMLTNSGVIQGGSLSTSQSGITNSGTLTGLTGLTLTHDNLVLDNTASGKILTQGLLTVSGKTLSSQGNWQGERILLRGQTLTQSGGAIRAADALDLTLTGNLTTGRGALISSNGHAAVKALAITHQGQWRATRLLIDGDSLRGSGESSGVELLDVRTGQLTLENGGALLSGNTLTVNTGTLSNHGRMMGNGVDIRTSALTNNGRIQADNGLTLVTTGNITNNAPGVIQSAKALSVKAPELTNYGLLQGGTDTGLTFSRQLSGNGRILAGGMLTFDAPELNNTGLLQATSLVLNAATLTNAGQVVVAGEATLGGDTLTNSGTLQAGSLTLKHKQQTYSGTVLGRQSTSVTADRVDLAANGKLYSGGGLSVVAGTLVQAGQIIAGGDLTLKLVNAFTASNTLAAGGVLSVDSRNAITTRGTLQGERISLTAGGAFTGDGLLSMGSGGGLISAASLVLNAAGKLQAGGDVVLTSRGNATNNGFTGTSGGLTMNVAGTLVNTALLYAGTNMDLFAGALHNLQGDILAGNRLRIQKNADGQRNSEVLNQSGTIETLQGDLNINTAWLRNTRAGLKTGEAVTENLMSKYPWLTPTKADIPVDWEGIRVSFDVIACPTSLGMTWCNPNYSPGPFGGGTIQVPKPQSGYKTLEFAVSKSSLAVTAEGGAGLISAGGNATVHADTLDNEASNILASGSMTLSGNTLNNRSWFPETVTRYVTYDFDDAYNSVELRYKARSGYREEVTQGTPFRSVLQAGSALKASFTQQINNGAMDSNAGKVTSTLRPPVLNLPGRVSTGSGQQLLAPGSAEHVSVGSPEWKDLLQSALVQIQGGNVPGNISGNAQPGDIRPGQIPGQTADKPAVDTGAYPLPSGDNGFFVVSADPQSPYLITMNPNLNGLGELDPQLFSDLYKLLGTRPEAAPRETRATFTDEQKFLGSSYLLDRLGLAPEKDYRFLGDAAFDTRYVSNALLNQIGNRYINGVGSDLEQMQYLMDSAARQQKALGLEWGVSLTADQIGRLTGSILWYEEVVINGQRVLVPRLYLAPDDVTVRNGSVIAGNNVSLSTGNLANNGSAVSADKNLSVTAAGTISNSGNAVLDAGEQLDLLAGNDILNVSSVISGKTVALEAINGSISNLTQGGQTTWRGQKDVLSWTETDRPALIRSDESLSLRAGDDILMTGGQLESGGDMTLSAGRDIDIAALETRTHTEEYDDRKKLTTRTSETRDAVRQTGSSLTSGGDIIMSAGQDLNVAASSVVATDDITLAAGRDIGLTTATESDHSHKEKKVAGGGFLGNSSKKTITESGSTREKGSLVSGDNVTVMAGHDLGVSGSSVVGDRDVALHAGNNVSVEAATNTDMYWKLKEEKRSGAFGGGGLSVTFGKSSSRHELKEKDTTQSQSASTIGSVGQDVSITAGNQLHVSGSDVIAGQDIRLKGDSVIIDPGRDERTRDETYRYSSGGLSVGLGGSAVEAAVNAAESAKAADRYEDDRLAALKGTQSVLSGVQAGQAVQQSSASGNPGNAIGISISVGGQSGKSSSHQSSSVSSGSTITAGNNLDITATGQGTSRNSGDIIVAGSQMKAGNDVRLDADQDILLAAASDTQQSAASNSSKGGNIGVSIGLGQNTGISIYGNAQASQGREKGNGTTWNETTVDAGHHLNLSSGRDTTLAGAQASGERVTAEAGRDLTITSLQDSDRYDSRQASASAGGSFTWGAGGGGYGSASRDNIHSNYDSVNEQSGIFAGQGGFDITVGNHTQLDGAVIASTAPADRNSLDTGTLGWTDIHNQADYKTSHTGVSAGMSSSGGSLGSQLAGNALANMGNSLVAGGGSEGHADGTTSSAVSAGTITVRDPASQQQDVAGLSRDTENANGSVAPIFDKEKEQRRLQEAQLISQITGQAGDIVRTHGDMAALEEARKDPKNAGMSEDGLRQTDAYRNKMKEYGTGSMPQMVVQAIGGVLGGLSADNLGQALAGGLNPAVARLIKAETGDNREANLMAHAVWGALAAQLGGKNATAGAAGAFSGEVAARYIIDNYYDGRTDNLSEQERQQISMLATIASGIAGGLAGNSTESAGTGAQASKNAVENNSLSGWENLPKGLTDVINSQGSLGGSMIQAGASPDEITAALVKNAQGQTPEGQDPVKGLLSAWGNFFGVPLDVVLSNEQMTPQKAAEIISSGVPTSEAKLMQYVAAKAFFTVAKSTDLGLSASNQKYVDILSPEAKQHILFGDSPTSGGHLYPGNPGKTVYPKDWSADKVVHEIGDIATSPDTKWFAQTGTGGMYTAKGDPAKWVAYEVRDGVRIRVVYQPATGKIVTAFPDNKPVPPASKPIKK